MTRPPAGTHNEFVQRKPWDSNPQAARAATCFQDRPLIRSDNFRLISNLKFRELESNQRLLVQSQGSRPTATAPELSRLSFTIRGGGLEPRIAGFKVRYPTIRRSPRVSCGSRTHLPSLEGWHLCRSVKDTSFTTSKAEGAGVEPSRHLRMLGRVRGGCHRQLACPSVFSKNHNSGGRARTSIC